MDLQSLIPIHKYTWKIPKTAEMKADAFIYADENLLQAMDEKVREQIINVAKLPGIVSPAVCMPDAHWGYGFPIGGVAAFEAEQGGIISAGGVGFDISCGIRCLTTDLTLETLLPEAEVFAHELSRAIPSGLGRGGNIHLSFSELDVMMQQGADFAVMKGYGSASDLKFVEESGTMPGAKPEFVSELAKKRQQNEMGTLGSGNHYLEIQVVDEIFDEETAKTFGIKLNQIIISIHCGSRGLGHQIGTEYLVRLAKAAKNFNIALPDRELACAPILSEEGQQYIGAMNAAINCALANRQILSAYAQRAFERFFPDQHTQILFDVSHNTCKCETHIIAGETRKLWVHRKGATRAFGPYHKELPDIYQTSGQPVIIDGSMGTGSYILAGNSPEKNHAFASACHGAGRTMSRNQALTKWQGKTLIKELAEKGIYIRSPSMRGIAEEAPLAYKDVDQVAEITETAGLARRVARLRPKICIKG